MEKISERSMVKFVVLSVLTGNLYIFYFYYKLSMDINALCEGDGKESESYLTAAVLSFLTFGLYGIYWFYKLTQRLRANAPRYGFKIMETGKDMVILNVFGGGFIAGWELIKNMNKFAKVYNQNGVAPLVFGGEN